MKSVIALLLVVLLVSTNAFVPSTPMVGQLNSRTAKSIPLNMGFMGGDEDPKPLTRDNEPEEYFSTNMDKMSDEEKLPIAIAGLAFISLPFIAGLIALYASK